MYTLKRQNKCLLTRKKKEFVSFYFSLLNAQTSFVNVENEGKTNWYSNILSHIHVKQPDFLR